MRVEHQGVKTQQAKSAEDILVTKWLDTVIARSHSMLQKVKLIANHQKNNQLTSISIRGREGTGKTTIAQIIAHLLHKDFEKFAVSDLTKDEYTNKQIMSARLGYVVKKFTRDDLLNLQETLDNLPKKNRIIIFDDISFITKMAGIKKTLTEIRHDKTGIDLKTVLMFNFHYSKALDKYVRDTQFIIQTSGSLEETKNLGEILGGTHHALQMSKKFIKSYIRFNKDQRITLNMTRTGDLKQRTITYEYSRPFRLALFTDHIAPGLFVYPSADKLGVHKCAVCNPAGMTSGNKAKILEWLINHHGEPSVSFALRVAAILETGHDPIHKHGNKVLEMIKRLQNNDVCRINDLIVLYHKNKNKTVVMEYLKRHPTVKQAYREAFFLTFGVDGLKGQNDSPLSAADIQGVSEHDK